MSAYVEKLEINTIPFLTDLHTPPRVGLNVCQGARFSPRGQYQKQC